MLRGMLYRTARTDGSEGDREREERSARGRNTNRYLPSPPSPDDEKYIVRLIIGQNYLAGQLGQASKANNVYTVHVPILSRYMTRYSRKETVERK